MISCQVSMIAEICICHAKICETVLRYKATLRNGFKTADRWSKESLRFEVLSSECMRSGLVAKISRFVSYSIVTDYSLLFQEVMTD